jgi:drug/metabolite transporter (DMT)-like permease
MTPIWAICTMIITSAISAFATFNLKIAASQISRSIKQTLKTKRLWVGVIFYGIGTLGSLFAIKAGELSVLYPFVALQYVWAVILSRRYLGEKIKALKWAGIAMIFIGVTMIGLGAR